jgi:hypothetical protein
MEVLFSTLAFLHQFFVVVVELDQNGTVFVELLGLWEILLVELWNADVKIAFLVDLNPEDQLLICRWLER